MRKLCPAKSSFLEMERDRTDFSYPDLAIRKITFGNPHSFKKMLVFPAALQEQADPLLNIRGFKVK